MRICALLFLRQVPMYYIDRRVLCTLYNKHRISKIINVERYSRTLFIFHKSVLILCSSSLKQRWPKFFQFTFDLNIQYFLLFINICMNANSTYKINVFSR